MLDRPNILTLLHYFLLIRIGPLVFVSTSYWRLVRNHDEVVSCCCLIPVFLQLNLVSRVSLSVQVVTINCRVGSWLILRLNTLSGRMKGESGWLGQIWRRVNLLESTASLAPLVPIVISSVAGWLWRTRLTAMVASRETTLPCRWISSITWSVVVPSPP